MTEDRRHRQRRTWLLVLAPLLLVAACGEKTYDSERVARIVDDTRPNPYRFTYEVELAAGTYEVAGIIEDDLRYKLQLSVNGTPAMEQIVVDDAVAVRFFDRDLIPTLIDENATASADLVTDVPGATVVDALGAQRWVLDEVGAPALLADTAAATETGDDTDVEGADDPLLDARNVLGYLREVATAQWMQKWDPDSLEPTYRTDEDPFPAPEEGSGIERYDAILRPLPNPGQAEQGTQAQFFSYMNVRRLAIYTKNGHILSAREVIELTPRQVDDVYDYTTRILELNAPGLVEDFQRSYRQLPPEKRPQMILDSVNVFRKNVGQSQLRYRRMSFDIEDLGDRSLRVSLPTDEVVHGSLAVLRNMGRKPLDLDSGKGADATTTTSATSSDAVDVAAPAAAPTSATDG